MDVGVLCHPKKITPPTQVMKCCGFLMDSWGIPCLHVPVSKREERALAVVEHLIAAPVDWAFLRLTVLLLLRGSCSLWFKQLPCFLVMPSICVDSMRWFDRKGRTWELRRATPRLLSRRRSRRTWNGGEGSFRGPRAALPDRVAWPPWFLTGATGVALRLAEFLVFHASLSTVESEVVSHGAQVLLQLEGVEHSVTHSGQPAPSGSKGGRQPCRALGCVVGFIAFTTPCSCSC
jgi:hypothetical protein